MSTGYSWEGIYGRYVRRCLVRAMYLSAFVVAMSTWGTISSVRPLPFTLPGYYRKDPVHFFFSKQHFIDVRSNMLPCTLWTAMNRRHHQLPPAHFHQPSPADRPLIIIAIGSAVSHFM